jgi:exopolysaccharide biosynthesis polyprenyl glycosylphosphotransferase
MRQRGRHRIIGHLRLAEETDKDVGLLMRAYPGVSVLGAATDIEQVLRVHAADEVYVAGNVRKHGDEMQGVIRVCEKFGVPFALPAYAFRLERALAVDGRAISDGYLHYQNQRAKPHQEAMKRLFDIFSSAMALWLLLPLFAVVIALIKLTSRGPVFFRQTRVGLHGREFAMLKFRSMVVNAEDLKESLARANEQSGPVFKMRNDPRITSIGRFIRKYSIDELPQLVNVLRGDMSIVGPRPPVPQEVSQYDAWQRRRLSVRPGLTCIWQVSGRNQISFEDWMYLDMQYIDHWSLARDFNLIFRTVPIVITGRGAS